MSKDDNKLQPVGDAELEARIVAWVLGEASAFEAEELEQRCAREPELRLFAAQMRELHGLIGENHAAAGGGTSGEWRLPEAKRRRVVDLLGVDEAPDPVVRGPWVKRMALAVAACLVAGLMAWPLLRKQGQFAAGREIIAYHPVSWEPEGRMDERKVAPAASPRGETEGWYWRDSGPNVDDEIGIEAPATPTTRPSRPAVMSGGERVDSLARRKEAPDSVYGMQAAASSKDAAEGPVPATAAPELAKKDAAALDGVDRVRGSLYRAEGNFNLGRFDDAKDDYEEVLREDPSNRAARRGLERVSQAKSDYYRAAYDQTRAELLAQVDKAWELEDAPQEEGAPASRMAGREVKELGELDAKTRDLALGGIADKEGPVSGSGSGGIAAEDRFAGTGRDFGLAGEGMESSGEELGDSAGFRFSNGPAAAEFAQLGSDFTGSGDEMAGARSYQFGFAESDGRSRAGGFRGNTESQVQASNQDVQLGLSTAEGTGGRTLWGGSLNGAVDELGTGLSAPAQVGEGRSMTDFVAPPAESAGDGLAFNDRDSDSPSSDFFDIVAAGNRSGDGAIHRDSISALLNQPDSAPGNSEFDAFAAAEPPASEAEGELELARQREAGARRKLAELEDLSSFETHGAVVQGVARQAYDVAMEDYEQSLALLEQLKVKQISEEMQKKIVEGGEGRPTKAESNSQSVDELREAVVAQEDVVEEKRKVLSAASRNRKVNFASEEGLGDSGSSFATTDEFTRLATEKVRLESQIETLLRYDGEQLVTYAAGLQLPDNLIRTLHPQYLEAERQLEALEQSGLGRDHPMLVQQQEVVEQMKRDLNEGVVALRETLRARLALANTQISRLEEGAELREQDVEDALDLMAEVAAEAEPYSTFSLHVGDASFELAAAAVGRGEMPEPARVRPEEFYNAFDYGDPAPPPGEPVACVVEQCAHPVFPQRNLMRIAVRTGSEGRAAQRPLNLTLMFDNSGSMEREDRAAGVSKAVEQLTTLLNDKDQVSVVGFARQPRLLGEKIAGSEAGRLNTLVDQLPAEGGTNLEQALGLAEELAMRNFDADGENRVVLFTDGAANLGDADPDSLKRRVERMRQNGIAFDAAGFGADGLNDRMLERLTRNGNGRYYLVDQPGDADEGFAKKLAGAFRPGAENVKVQLRFNPERVGRYKLIGFDEHRLAKEDFRNDAVDAAEMAAEEAGVALYQFEVLPEGRGEVGEVSVRFRDPASGAMVERRWTIPYDAQAPAFDEAAESLQLAGLAAMAAEKFRGAPMAEAIEFGEMSQVVGQVKARFGASERVGELERMIDVLR